MNTGDLNPGDRVFFKFKVTVNSNVTDGVTLENVGKVRADEVAEKQCANRIKVVVPPVGAPAPAVVTAAVTPSLTVKKFVVWDNKEWNGGVPKEIKKFQPGDEIVYRIKVENSTDAVAKDVKVEDRVQDPFVVDFVRNNLDASWNNGNKIASLDLKDIAAKTTRTWDIVFKVRSGIETNKDIEQKNVVVVTSSNAGSPQAEAKITVIAPTAPAVAPAAQKAPTKLPATGPETDTLFLVLGMTPVGIALRRFRLI